MKSLCCGVQLCVCVWWVDAFRREAFSVRSRWLRAILCRVFQSTKTHARTFWWVGQSLLLYSWAHPPLLLLQLVCYRYSIASCALKKCILHQFRGDHMIVHLFFCDVSALPRWEASSLRDLWEDFLSVWQQERPHEEEAWRGGAQYWKQRNRSFSLTLSFSLSLSHIHTYRAVGGYANPWIM